MTSRKITFVMILSLMFLLYVQPYYEKTYALWEEGEIDDINNWIYASNLVNFTQDYKLNFFFRYSNETLGIEFYPRLSLHTRMNIPLNLTGYLTKKIKKEEASIGLQLGSNNGNITLGINGTIIGKTPITDYFFIDLQEGESTIANYETIIGDNISIPINFNPIIFSLRDIVIPEAESVSLAIKPNILLKGTIGISANVDGEKLSWNESNKIYFEDVSVLKNMSVYNVEVTDISFDFKNIVLVTESIDFTLILDTVIGKIKQNFNVDLQDVEWEEGEIYGGEFIIFLLDTLVDIDDQTIYILIAKAGFPFSSIFIVMVVFTGFLVFKRKKRN